MATTPKRRARTNRHASQRSLASELAQSKAALETLAQMVVGGRLNSDGLLAALRSTSGAESLGDAMRARLIEAALAINAVEAANPSVWEHADWREACDDVAFELSTAGTHAVAIERLAAAPSRPARLR
jgi:hypothetical protein